MLLEAFHMGGCHNYGPFLGPYYNTAPNISIFKGTQKRTTILTTTHIFKILVFCYRRSKFAWGFTVAGLGILELRLPPGLALALLHHVALRSFTKSYALGNYNRIERNPKGLIKGLRSKLSPKVYNCGKVSFSRC